MRGLGGSVNFERADQEGREMLGARIRKEMQFGLEPPIPSGLIDTQVRSLFIGVLLGDFLNVIARLGIIPALLIHPFS